MNRLSHESLTVCQRSIELVSWAAELTAQKQAQNFLPDQFNEHLFRFPLVLRNERENIPQETKPVFTNCS